MANNPKVLEGNIENLSEKAENLEAEIHEACCDNETEKVIAILEKNRKDIDVAEIDRNGSILVAIENKNELVVSELLKIGCEPNVEDNEGHTPLHYATLYRNCKIVKALLENGANVNCQSKDGLLTPLHYAAEDGDLEIAELLLQHNADVDIVDFMKWSALFLAVSNHKSQIVEILLRNGAKSYFYLKQDLHLFKNFDRVPPEIVKIFFKYYAVDISIKFVNRNGNTILEEALCKKDVEFVKSIAYQCNL